MEKIAWCKQKERGISIRKPSINLAQEYFSSAEESLKVLNALKESNSRMWLATTKYYTQYFAVYAVLMRLGIKCEIHECTLAIVKFLEEENIFEKGVTKLLEDAKELRIENQYYLKNKAVIIDFDQLTHLLLAIKKTLDALDTMTITRIRKKFQSL